MTSLQLCIQLDVIFSMPIFARQWLHRASQCCCGKSCPLPLFHLGAASKGDSFNSRSTLTSCSVEDGSVQYVLLTAAIETSQSNQPPTITPQQRAQVLGRLEAHRGRRWLYNIYKALYNSLEQLRLQQSPDGSVRTTTMKRSQSCSTDIQRYITRYPVNMAQRRDHLPV